MSDLRYDPLNDTWVAISETRTERPNEYPPSGGVIPLERCPFCLGNERETPPAIAQYGWDPTDGRLIPADRQDWLVRVVPNRFPAFEPADLVNDGWLGAATGDGTPAGRAAAEQQNVYPYGHELGRQSRQELIIESPRHVESYSQLTTAELAAAFLVYRQRLEAYRRLPGLKYVLLFKNCRPEAGASLAHIHSQLFGLDFVPAAVAGRERRLSRPAPPPEAASSAAPQNGRSVPKLLQQMAAFEQHAQQRVVETAEHWLAFCPFASRFAYQTWIVPQRHWGPYWDQSDTALQELAVLVQRWVASLERMLDKPAYNVIFHNPILRPKRAPSAQVAGHAYVELFARIGNVAGFEWGSNCWINTISPETAARQLRESTPERWVADATGYTQLQRDSSCG
jgi:UDPglucose--hexose-1-phosphate uridylyltransferase